MTERIYYTDAYAREFRARVTSRSEDATRVVLDRTAFYPTSGGQLYDTGLLNGVPVLDVVDEDNAVIHVLASPLRDDDVAGRIDWQRRFDHMQQHTGQHVLSAVFEDLFGFRTASVHFGIDSSSVDLEVKEVSREQILAAEARANSILFDNLPVLVTFEEGSTATGLRKPPPREGVLRVISVEGIDRSACGGTHVHATGEIGTILLRKQEKMHGGARVEFVCGDRAVRRARADYDALARVAAALGVSLDEVADQSKTLVTESREAARDRKKLAEELAVFRARSAYESAVPDAGGVRWVIERIANGSLDDIRAMAHATIALPRAAFIGVVDDPPQVLFATSEDSGIDAGRTLKASLAANGGRGGGSARAAQGSVPAGGVGNVIAALRTGSAD